MKRLEASVSSIEYYLPKKTLSNRELNDDFGENERNKKMYAKIGVENRHICSDDEYVSDMAVVAGLKLFDNQNISPNDIDLLILCTQSPDYLLPTTACIIQHKLNLPTNCGAFDINLGCSGFVYGLAVAKSFINTNIAKNVLLIMADTYSKHINLLDKSTRPIFGDAAAAVLVSSNDIEGSIGEFRLGTDGKGAHNLMIQAGGTRLPKSEETDIAIEDKNGNFRSLENLYMNGPEIFKFAISRIPTLVKDTLEINNLQIDEIDVFVFHQASKYLLEYLRKELNIPENKFYTNITNIGNTVSASIPIALKDAESEGRLKKGDKVMLIGFGIGYSWGGTVISW